MIKNKKRFWFITIILVALLAMAFVICMRSPLNPFAKDLVTETDSSVFKYIGWRMTLGEVPYKDIFDHKGILLYFINYLGTLLSFHRGIWLIEFIFMFLSLGLSYKIFRKFCKPFGSLLATLLAFSPLYAYFEGGNLTEEYALPFILLSVYIFVDFFTSSEKYLSSNSNQKKWLYYNGKWLNSNVILCGISFACTFFLRPNMIAVWIVFCIAIFIFCLYKKWHQEIFKFVVSFFIGILIIAIPIMIYLVVNGAFNDFMNDFFLFNFVYSSNEVTATTYHKISSFFGFFNTSTCLLAFIIMIWKLYDDVQKKDGLFYDISYLIYMILNLVLISMSGMQYPHYGILILPTLIYPYGILFQSLEHKKMKNISPYIIGYLVLVMIMPTWSKYLENTFLRMNQTSEMKWKSDYSKDPLILYIKEKTDENDEIAIYGNKNAIYNFTKTKSASKYSYMTSTLKRNKKIMKEYFDELEEKKPQLFLWMKEEEDPNEKRVQSFLKSNQYHECNEFDHIDVYCLEEFK